MNPVRIFWSYSHRDEGLREALREHLAPLVREGLIAEWHDRKIVAGDAWEVEIDEQLSIADIVLILLSPSYIASEFCWSIELPKALERLERREIKIIPVVLRPCLWQNTPLSRLQAVPKNARPVTDWQDQDLALVDIVGAIRLAAEEIVRKWHEKDARDDRHFGDGLNDVPQSLLRDVAVFSDLQAFREIDSPWCPQMVVLPAGEFAMGTDPGDDRGWPDERPQRTVSIEQRFAIGLYPVTFTEYNEFCEAEDRSKPDDAGWGQERRPAINVSWRDARAYVAWLSKQTQSLYRLVTEAEWEYACRATGITAYANGETLSEAEANFANVVGGTTEVGAYPPNLWQIYDMHGNVWEWVEDTFRTRHERTDIAGISPGIEAGTCRTVRGGCWNSSARQLRSAARLACPAELRSRYVGFRIARSI